jgi:hypothetical protein
MKVNIMGAELHESPMKNLNQEIRKKGAFWEI